MIIQVKIYSYLRYYLPNFDQSNPDEKWDTPEGTTVVQVLERLNLPKGMRITVLLNGNSVDGKTVLKEGDVLHLLPQMAGG